MKKNLYYQALELTRGREWITPGTLQKLLKVTYRDALDLLEQMEQNNIVGREIHWWNARQVLTTKRPPAHRCW